MASKQVKQRTTQRPQADPQVQERLRGVAAEWRHMIFGEKGCPERGTLFRNIEADGMSVGLKLARLLMEQATSLQVKQIPEEALQAPDDLVQPAGTDLARLERIYLKRTSIFLSKHTYSRTALFCEQCRSGKNMLDIPPHSTFGTAHRAVARSLDLTQAPGPWTSHIFSNAINVSLSRVAICLTLSNRVSSGESLPSSAWKRRNCARAEISWCFT